MIDMRARKLSLLAGLAVVAALACAAPAGAAGLLGGVTAGAAGAAGGALGVGAGGGGLPLAGGGGLPLAGAGLSGSGHGVLGATLGGSGLQPGFGANPVGRVTSGATSAGGRAWGTFEDAKGGLRGKAAPIQGRVGTLTSKPLPTGALGSAADGASAKGGGLKSATNGLVLSRSFELPSRAPLKGDAQSSGKASASASGSASAGRTHVAGGGSAEVAARK